MAVVILDEMDQLLSQDHSVLYDLFRLPQVRAGPFEKGLDCAMHQHLASGLSALTQHCC